MAGRRVRLRRQGVRRHRGRDGKAVVSGRRPWLAGQAHQSRLARVRLVAVSRRDLHRCRTAPRRGRAGIIAARAGTVSTSARHRRFPRPTGSTRGAAFPISPSRTRDRSRANSEKPSATASMAATIAWRSVRGTSSRRRATRQDCRRATNCVRPTCRACAAGRCGVSRPVCEIPGQAHRPRPFHPQRIDRDRQLERPEAGREADRLLGDESALVRGAAVWALSQLLDAEDFAALALRTAEAEETVQAEWQRNDFAGAVAGSARCPKRKCLHPNLCNRRDDARDVLRP